MAHTRTDNQVVALVGDAASSAITLDAGPDVTVAGVGAHGYPYDRVPHMDFIEVVNLKGSTEPIYFNFTFGDDATVFADPTAPTVGANGEWAVSTAAGDMLPVPVFARAAKFKLICHAAATVQIRAARVMP